MRSMKFAAGMVVLSLGLGITAASASADQMANATTCLDVATKVKTALDANTQSANYDSAMKERRYGDEFCTNSFYAKGIAHYNRALQLLGVAQKADATDGR